MSESAAGIVDTVTKFLDRNLPADKHRALLAKGGWDPGFMAQLAALGLFVLTRDAGRDGVGEPLSGLRELFELIGERLIPGPLAEQLVLQWLLAVPAEGLVAFADPGITTEWDADIGQVVVENGALRGRVELVRFAAQAEYVLFVASVANAGDAGPGHALVLIKANDPAITITDATSLDPTSHYSRVLVRDRVLRPDEIIHDASGTTAVLQRIRAWLRIVFACELAGIARHVLNRTVEYVTERQQFGRPVGSFQGLKHLIAGMAQDTLSLQALCEAVIEDAGSSGVEDLELGALTLKAYANRAARSVCENGLQAHGGIGFTMEYDLHWYLRRAFALRPWYGDEHELTPQIGEMQLLRKTASA